MTEGTRALARLAMAAGAVAMIVGASWACSGPEGDEGGDAAAVAATEVTPRGSGVAGWTIEAAAPLAIAKAALPERGIVPLDLRLPGPPGDGTVVRGRIRATGEDSDRERPLNGRVVDDEKATARVGVPADFLVPGAYQIEIEVEASDPLRYRLDVR